MTLSSAWRVGAIIGSFDAQELDDHAEHYVQFTERWFVSIGAGEQVEIAQWAQTCAVLEWCHIPDLRAWAVDLLLRAIRAQIAVIADLADTAEIYADGPDAGISKRSASAIRESATQLRNIPWPELEVPESR
ncbi:hypothetical protein [Glutamicibacter sp. PS]|uniref:hypothetical protein n=1 Tax=Glutamicibacter sp. PS TaxID=3075634 RepID=UPI002852487E|nr:hypothetical protein [Glutamicibacter sp. PS]MDR4532085.1 hypothetical protein [Glutamicibacter sp. PS]